MYKLLIVDDEPLTRQFFKMNASQLHPQWECVGEAGDGEEALALIDRGVAVDLVLTDIKMPGMSGLELAQNLAARPSSPYVVILSGYDEFSMVKEAMQHDAVDYLLKPIVNEEVTSVLQKLADQLTANRSDEDTYRTLLSFSTESRMQVARNFLRAVISDNNMEIKVLYPILHRLKISLLDAEGAIMIVDLDESQFLDRDITLGHQTLYRYIVHQTASELTANNASVIPFIDNEERTVFFVAGDDANDVFDRCKCLFSELSRTIFEMTKLQLWGAYGTSDMEVLQMNMSYRKAYQVMKHRVFVEPNINPSLLIEDVELDSKGRRLDKAVISLHAAFTEGLDMQLHASLQAIAKELEPIDRRKLVVFGSDMMKRLNGSFTEESKQERIGVALKIMKQHEQPSQEGYSIEVATTMFRHMLEILYSEEHHHGHAKAQGVSEHEIVTKVKAFIRVHFAEPLSLADIAEKMEVSYSYLSSLFHQNNQESYIKFLTRVRMEHAASLLRKKPAEKVYDVAEEVGYLSVKHFSYVFKQHFGVPPGHYQDKELH